MFFFFSIDDPAIAMLKGVVEAHVEALRASIVEEVQGPLTVALKAKLKSMKESFNQTIEEACQKVVKDVNAIIQKEIAQRVADALKSDDVSASLKEEISKRVAEALNDKEIKVSNDVRTVTLYVVLFNPPIFSSNIFAPQDELSGDEDDADNEPGNLSDVEVCLSFESPI